MFDIISRVFFSIFSVYGLIGLAAFGLYMLAAKVRATSVSWIFALVLGCGAAFATQFGTYIAFLMVLGIIPLQPWPVITWALVAYACIFVSGYSKPSRWLILIPCAVVAVINLAYGIGVGVPAKVL